jgi:predicted small secreted protein
MPRAASSSVDRREFQLPHWAVLLVAALLVGASLAGCNTMQGAGEDISAAGDTLSDTAEDVAD